MNHGYQSMGNAGISRRRDCGIISGTAASFVRLRMIIDSVRTVRGGGL